MKRRDLVGLYLLSVLVWSVLSVSGAVAAQEKGNLLLNGGFETPVSVEEWKLYGNSIPVVQNLVKYSGEYAVRLEKDGPKSLNGGLVSGSRNRIKIEPGCRYVFSLWIKCAPGADVSIRLAEYSPEGEWLQRYYAVGKSNAAEWRELKGDYMPTDPEVAAVAVDIRSDGGPVFIDDISLIQTEKAGQIPEGDNLISNPGFEEGGCATGWLLYQSVDGNSVPEAPAGAGRSAGRGLKVTPAGLGAKSSLNAIKPGRRYLLSLWIRTGGTGRVEARLSKFNSDKGWLKDRGILIGTNSTSKWQKVSCIFSPRSDEFFATVEIVSRGGVAFADDISFYLLAAEGSASSSAATPAGTVPAVAPERFVAINLVPYANMGFKDEVADDGKGGWTDQGLNDLRWFKSGRLLCDGVPFEIIDPERNDNRSCLVLRGKERPSFPSQINGIRVNEKIGRLYFLHAAGWAEEGSGKIGRAVINYQGRRQEGIRFSSGRNIGDWWAPGNLPEARLGWTGRNPVSGKIGVWVYAWDNPYPDERIDSIDLVSAGTGGVYGLIALTGEKRVKMAALQSDIEQTAKEDMRLSVTTSKKLFYLDETVRVQLTASKGLSDRHKLEAVVSLVDCGTGCPVLKKSTEIVFAGSKEAAATVDIDLHLLRDLSPGAYRVTASLSTNGSAAEAVIAFMGAHPPQLSKNNFTSYPEPIYGTTLYQGKAYNEKKLKEIKNAGFDFIRVDLYWRDLEPKRGCYNWDSLDHLISMAGQAGLRFEIMVTGWHLPEWLEERMLSDAGDIGMTAPLWGKNREALPQLWRQIAARYRDNPNVVLYSPTAGAIDGPLHGSFDHPLCAARFYDYSEPSQKAWRAYLRDKRGISLKEASELYGKRFDSWEEVLQPTQREYQSKNPRHPLWLAFLDFRIYSVESLYEEMWQSVRQADSRTPINVKIGGGLTEGALKGNNLATLLDLCAKYGVLPVHTGFEGSSAAVFGALCRKHGLQFMTEVSELGPGKDTSNRALSHALGEGALGVSYVIWERGLHGSEWPLFKPYYKRLKGAARQPDNLVLAWLSQAAIYDEKNFYRFAGGQGYLLKLLQEAGYQPSFLTALPDRLPQGQVYMDLNSPFISRRDLQKIKTATAGGCKYILNAFSAVQGEERFSAEELIKGGIGTIACRRWTKGQGLLLIDTPLSERIFPGDENGLQDLDRLLSDNGVKRNITVRPFGVERTLLRKDDNYYLLLSNHLDHRVTAEVDFTVWAGKEAVGIEVLLGGELNRRGINSLAVEMEAYDLAIIMLSGERKSGAAK